MERNKKDKLGFLQSTALVIGNMIGSGIFLLPASLAIYGNTGLLGWGFSFIGAMILSLVFGKLSKLMPTAAGGPYEYTKKAFGNWSAYMVAWCYWASIWFANAAIVVSFLGYLTVFFPSLENNVILKIGIGWFVIWFFTWVNSKSIRFVGNIQVLTTLFKIIPLFVIGIVGVFYIDYQNLDFHLDWNFKDITATISLTFFAFQGLESASITSDETEGDDRTVMKATIFGTLITSIIYIVCSFAVMALLSPDVLAKSTSPFADASQTFLGPAAKYIVAAAAMCSALGALNGWILIQGHIPMVAAQDKLFPAVFGIKNHNGSPAIGIAITSVITSILMLFNFINGLVSVFTLMISLSTLAVLVPYIFTVASYVVTVHKIGSIAFFEKKLLPLLAIIFLFWVLSGCGWSTLTYGLSFILAGVLFYYATVKYRSTRL